MRLNSLEIENITSLMGKHFIDFEEILKEGELFAITGPTGSGKSSILTAISLALYGKNYKKNLDSKDFVSLGTASANIKLYFSTKGNQYCASWSLKVLKKNGEPIKKPSPQRIVTKDGVAIESSPEEIIGLTFDQFIRSVVLNQGQFSKFLTSNFSERRKILERLYSENELSEINKKLRETLSTQKQEIEKLSIKLDSSLPYTEDEILEAEQELPKQIDEKNDREKNFNSLQEIHNQLKDVLEFSSKRIQFSNRIKDINIQLEQANQDVNKQIDLIRKKTKAYDTFKVGYTEKVEKLKKAISVRSKVENISESLNSLNDSKLRIENKTKDISLERSKKDEDLKSLKANKVSLEERGILSHLDSIQTESIEDCLTKIQSIEDSNIVYKENIESRKNELSQTEVEGKKLAAILETQQSNIFDIFKTKDFEKHYQENLSIIESKINELNKDLLLREQAQEKKNKLKDELKAIDLKTKKETLTKADAKIKALELDLKRSQEKEKEQKKNEVLIDLLDQSIKDSECKVCTQKVDINFLESIKSDLVKTLNKNQGLINISEVQEQITQEQSKYTLLEHDIKTLSEKRDSLTNEIKDLETTITNFDKQLKQQTESTEEKKKLQQNYNLCREIHQSVILTTEKINALREDFKKIRVSIEQSENRIQENTESSKELGSKISELINESFTVDKIDHVKKSIKQTNEYHKVLGQIENIQTINDSLQKQLNSLEVEKKDCEFNITKLSFDKKELEKELTKLTGDSNIDDALSELEKQRESMESELKELSKKKSQLETEYTRLLTSLDSLKDQINSLENSIISALGNITTINFQVDNLASDNKETKIFLEKVKALKTYPETEETIQGLKEGSQRLLLTELNIFKERLNSLVSSISKSEEKISLYRSKEAEQTKDKALLKELTGSFDRLNNLADVLGRNKDEFRNFVLGFIEQQLIQNTNQELSKICDGRYGLTQKESTHGHDFFISDRWNGAMERKVTTLSGGETFLVSLAMALTLAEMTRGQVDIDCFFIDEGFGSLDADSIEDAFSALMSVRSRGKQIGIISHIKELTSRIPANINLNKSAEGQSKIEYLYN